MRTLITIITATCFLGNTFINAAPIMAENIAYTKLTHNQTINASKNTGSRNFSKLPTEEYVKQSLCLHDSYYNSNTVTIPSSFDFNCILALILEDFNLSTEAAKQLANNILLTLPDVYLNDPEKGKLNPISFFSLSTEERTKIFEKLTIHDGAIQELIQHLPPTLDGDCLMYTDCPEHWLDFFEYLYQKTKNPFWKELHYQTQVWLDREYDINKYPYSLNSMWLGLCILGFVTDLAVYIPALSVHIIPQFVKSPVLRMSLLGAGLIASESLDYFVSEIITHSKTGIFHQIITPLVNLLIAYRAYTWLSKPGANTYAWLPELGTNEYYMLSKRTLDKYFLVASPIILEGVRKYSIVQVQDDIERPMANSDDMEEEVFSYSTIRCTNIIWGMYVLYMSIQYAMLQRQIERQRNMSGYDAV